MELQVPIIRQEIQSSDCGIAALSMIMSYYGINKSIADIKDSVKVYEGIWTYMPQLGEYLLQNGFDVEIITMNPLIFTKQFEIKTQEELIKYFDKLETENTKEKSKEPLLFFKKFLKAGGRITPKIPNIHDFKEEISNNRPIIALVTSNFLWSDKANFNFHFNIITGIDENYIYVNDPMWDNRGGKHKYEINDFMYAIYASAYGDIDNASIMKIRKKQLYSNHLTHAL